MGGVRRPRDRRTRRHGPDAELMRPRRPKRARSEPAADVSRDASSPVAASGPTHQLAEFLTPISRFNDEQTATRTGSDHVPQGLDAAATALVRGGAGLASRGVPPR